MGKDVSDPVSFSSATSKPHMNKTIAKMKMQRAGVSCNRGNWRTCSTDLIVQIGVLCRQSCDMLRVSRRCQLLMADSGERSICSDPPHLLALVKFCDSRALCCYNLGLRVRPASTAWLRGAVTRSWHPTAGAKVYVQAQCVPSLNVSTEQNLNRLHSCPHHLLSFLHLTSVIICSLSFIIFWSLALTASY